MDQDPNVIFTLRAISDYAQEAFQLLDNKKYYVARPPLKIVTATSRESSVATNIGDKDGEGDGDALETRNAEGKGDPREGFGHQLRFTFDQKPKNIQDGWVFGSNPKTCDVIMGSSIDSISGSHFRITFDDQKRLVLIDSSASGTAVSYGGRARDEKRKNPKDRKRKRSRVKSNDFKWILFPEIKNKSVVIEGTPGPGSSNVPIVEFSVEVANPKTRSCWEEYTRLTDVFLDEMRTAIPFGLNIDSAPTTAGQTESHSPTQRPEQRPIWIDLEEIGSGQYGTVYQAVDVSTGLMYATKKLLRNCDRQQRWDREVAILRSLSHPHIVNSPLTKWETVILLGQGLKALHYLHSHNIVHRDLKPANILVQCREFANFHIKIADFGTANDSSVLKTPCGTLLYAAPEIWHPYTNKVDIWSLGVIVFEYGFGLPNCEVDAQWYPKLIETVRDMDSDELRNFLASSMVIMDPKLRLPARACLEKSAKLREAITPTQDLEKCPGTPTESMSSSAVMEAYWGTKYGGQGAGETAKLSDFPLLSIEHSLEHVNPSVENVSRASKRAMRSGCQTEEYQNTITQLWESPPDEDDQRIELGVDAKRQRTKRAGEKFLPDNQQTPWKRHEDQVLTELPDCIQMDIEPSTSESSEPEPSTSKSEKPKLPQFLELGTGDTTVLM
ncbi:kinase-like protein [Amniculicola lignicola CBS 123094]|uniref:Kinase-like protein n=1 Tax=Amniculicola lignicola CBS 123094 TaxID=1392246 RepID=A0A6A5X4P2_9PLEO|nr:kinase-like protein [Amniculicola lignicola CBS 123094]